MKRLSGMLCAALLLGACTQDSPTEAGGGLLPPNAIRTFEIVLPPELWLQLDTAFNVYSDVADADFLLLANNYQGGVDSRGLMSFTLPRTITLPDSLDVVRTDSTPIFFAAELRMLADTIATTPRPSTVELYRATESWDRFSANWTHRVDTTGVQIPWTQPGGSPGALVGSGDVPVGANDTVRIPVDSATLALWADTTNPVRGAVLTAATSGARVRVGAPTLFVRARSTMNPDTVLELPVTPTQRTFIFTPEQPVSTPEPRIGGTPVYRTIMRLRERLDTLTLACPGVPGCTVRLSDVSLNYAAIQLQPVPAPAGFDPERPVAISLHALLPSDLIPIQRSPITGTLSVTPSTIPTSSFLAPGAPIADVPATELFRILLRGPAAGQSSVATDYIALLPAGVRTFGVATFAEMPSLRLVISIARELQLP